MFSKSQVSIEYMMIIGFVTIMTVPMLFIYYNYTNETKDSVATGQALQIARKVIDSAESVYYLGRPSQTTLRINFPENIKSINISNKEIVLKVSTQKGVTDVVSATSINLNGTLPTSPGLHTVIVKAQEGFVQISSN